MRIMILGIAPGKNGDLKRPFFPSKRSGKTLRCWFGEDAEERFILANASMRFLGKNGSKGDRVPRRLSIATRDLIRESRPELIIAMGLAVAQLLGASRTNERLDDAAFETRSSDLNVPVMLFPHPSGVNRWLNDPKNRKKTIAAARCVRAMTDSSSRFSSV